MHFCPNISIPLIYGQVGLVIINGIFYLIEKQNERWKYTRLITIYPYLTFSLYIG